MRVSNVLTLIIFLTIEKLIMILNERFERLPQWNTPDNTTVQHSYLHRRHIQYTKHLSSIIKANMKIQCNTVIDRSINW